MGTVPSKIMENIRYCMVYANGNVFNVLGFSLFGWREREGGGKKMKK